MPSTMTMQWPNARIIRIVLDDSIPRRCRVIWIQPGWLHHMRVSPDRIAKVAYRSAIGGTVALVDYKEIVAVKMHGVGGVEGIDGVIEHDADGIVLAEVVDVPFGRVRVGDVAAVDFAEDGVAMLVVRVDMTHEVREGGRR